MSLLVLLSLLSVEAAYALCPTGYDGPSDACFKVSRVAATFVECQESVCGIEGGSLASLRTKDEYEWVKAILDERDIGAFIGLFQYRSREWINVDGFSEAYTQWAPGQPDNWCLDEDVALLYPDLWPGGLIDISAGVLSFCVCRANESPSSSYYASLSRLSNADANYNQCDDDQDEEDRQEDEILLKINLIQREVVALLILIILICIALVFALAFAFIRHLHTLRALANLSSEPIPAYGLELSNDSASEDSLVMTGGRGAV